jgi:hypothetical protein
MNARNGQTHFIRRDLEAHLLCCLGNEHPSYQLFKDLSRQIELFEKLVGKLAAKHLLELFQALGIEALELGEGDGLTVYLGQEIGPLRAKGPYTPKDEDHNNCPEHDLDHPGTRALAQEI